MELVFIVIRSLHFYSIAIIIAAVVAAANADAITVMILHCWAFDF